MNDYRQQVYVTPEMARTFLEKNSVNRPVNKIRVESYAQQMRCGQWVDNGESISFGRDGQLLNGQHRLYAVIKCNQPVRLNIRENVDDKSFSTYDCGMSRTVGQVFSMAKITYAHQISSGISFYFSLRNFNILSEQNVFRKNSRQDFLNEYKANADLYDVAAQLSYKCYRFERLMKQREILGFTIYLVKEMGYEYEEVEEFFTELCLDVPTSCQTITLLKGRLRRNATGALKLETIYKRMFFVKTWNSYVTGKPLFILKWNPEREKNYWFLPKSNISRNLNFSEKSE